MTSSTMSIGDPLESSLWDVVCSDFSQWKSNTARQTLRVLHVVNGEHYAGAERVQDLLAARLPEFGVEVAFACIKPKRFPEARQCQSTPLVNFPMRSRFDLRPAWRLARMVREERFDLIHTHTPRAAMVGQIAARLAGVPLVHHVHGHTAVEVGQGWRTWLSAKAEKYSLAGAAAVIAVSPTAAQYISRWGVRRERIHLVPNGVPARKQFSSRPIPRMWTIGAIALFRPRKGLEVLLEAIAILRRQGQAVQLRVVGGFETSAYQDEVRRLSQQMGIAPFVEWRGFRQDVDAELDALDLLVLPSVLPEGMPMVLLEALASGVPPLGSRVDGITDVIEHGRNGLLFEPGSAASIAEAVAAVINGRHDWRQLRRNAMTSHAERFSDRGMASGVADVYRKVLHVDEHD